MPRATAVIEALGQALDHAHVSLEVADRAGRIFAVNDTFERLTGYTRAEIIGRTPKETLRSEYHTDAFLQQLWTGLESGQGWSGHLWSRCKDGSVVAFDAIVVPTLVDGVLEHVMAIRRPAAERQQHEERYKAVLTAALDAVLISDFDTALYFDVNPAACELFGYTREEFKSKNGRMLCAEGQGELVTHFSGEMHRHGHFKDTLRFTKSDGTVFWAEVSAATFEVASHKQQVTIVRDVDARVQRDQALQESYQALRETQAQLLHASQLATIGQVAAGVAHEINNPINYVDLNLDSIHDKLDALAESMPGASEESRKLIAEMRELTAQCKDGTERIGTITRDLRTYGRADDEKLGPVDVREIATAAVRMVQNEVRHVAVLVTELAEVPLVIGGAMRIGQVITNLLVNAAHAVADASPSREHRVRLSVAADGGDVCIVVSDTGPGIPDDLREKVFEPFFTTKARGRGTGLGLSLCAEIVRQHKGTIRCTSTAEGGACVEVRLPSTTDKKFVRPSQQPAPDVTDRRLRVLLVDDEPMLLTAFTYVLQKSHDVVAAGGGLAAIELLEAGPPFDVVVCDLMMPDVDGQGVFERAQELDPCLAERMLFVSGGAITKRTRAFALKMQDRLLSKPLKPRTLIEAVTRVTQTPQPLRMGPSAD